MAQIPDLLHLDAITVTGRTVGENIAGAEIVNPEVIRTADDPLDTGGALVVLRGSLCPDGAVMKITAADPRLAPTRRARRSSSRTSTISPRGSTTRRSSATRRASWCSATPGRSGRPACPNGGTSRSRQSSCKEGVSDLLRISDARMSGTSYGAIVLHVSPESAVGGPLALVARRRPDPPRRGRAAPRPRRRAGRARRAPSALAAAAAARTSAGTDSFTPITSCRPTRAATSTSSAARRRWSRTR